MEAQDDPEARIRELERPLADVAKASELGAPPPPPPPPPAAWDAPASNAPTVWNAPPPRKSGMGAGWFVLAGGVLAVVVAAGAIAYFAVSRVNDAMPQIGGGGFIDSSPTLGTPTVGPKTPGATVITAPEGQPVGVAGVGETRSIFCENGTVSVSGVNNVVTITGHCDSLTVSGMDNAVEIDSADSITASGFDNRVTWHSGSPRVDSSGGNNTVEQG